MQEKPIFIAFISESVYNYVKYGGGYEKEYKKSKEHFRSFALHGKV